MYLSVCVVSLVPHFSSPTSVWISMVSKSGSKFWSVCFGKATNKLRLLFLSWHTSHTHTHTHTHIYSIKKHYEWLVHQQSRPELRAMFRGWVDKWSLSNSPPCRSPAASIPSTPALPTCELQCGSFSVQFSPGFKPCASFVTSTAGRYPNWKLARADGIFWVWVEGMGRQRWDTVSEHGQWWQLVKRPQAQWRRRGHTELPCATVVWWIWALQWCLGWWGGDGLLLMHSWLSGWGGWGLWEVTEGVCVEVAGLWALLRRLWGWVVTLALLAGGGLVVPGRVGAKRRRVVEAVLVVDAISCVKLRVLQPCDQTLVFVAELASHQRGLSHHHHILQGVGMSVWLNVFLMTWHLLNW